MTDIEKLQGMIDESKKIVFFGGAGVSTESGIKDFRSVDGLYNEKYDYPPEVMLSRSFFNEHKQEFYKFYKDKLNTTNYKPNITHIVLKEMEDNRGDLIVIFAGYKNEMEEFLKTNDIKQEKLWSRLKDGVFKYRNNRKTIYKNIKEVFLAVTDAQNNLFVQMKVIMYMMRVVIMM